MKKGSHISRADIQENRMWIKNIAKRWFTSWSKFQNNDTLLARITPCLENGKTAFVNWLKDNEIAFGSTEFIVMRPRENISPFRVYCLARDENFRSHAISSMIWSSWRQRVHSDYLKEYKIFKIDSQKMKKFHSTSEVFFENIRIKMVENRKRWVVRDLLLSKIATID